LASNGAGPPLFAVLDDNFDGDVDLVVAGGLGENELQFRNNGNATLTVSGVTTSSGVEFPLSNVPSLPANLAPGASLSLAMIPSTSRSVRSGVR